MNIGEPINENVSDIVLHLLWRTNKTMKMTYPIISFIETITWNTVSGKTLMILRKL